MGIARTVAYGILLTDEFGGPRKNTKALWDLIDDPYETRPWLVWCPSAEALQLVVGISAKISKTTDFSALHKRWEKAIAQAPQTIRELVKTWEPDVVFLAGKN